MISVTDSMNDTDSAVVWTDQGRAEYQKMAYHVAAIAYYHGKGSDYHVAAADSFARVSESIVGWGNVRVARDGDLSLICSARGLTFGIIFHKTHRSCTVEGCREYLSDEGRVWSYQRTDERKVQLHRHEWLYPIGAPIPGSWSFHS
jgi:hypothetical protein